jgi:hypothetical protein
MGILMRDDRWSEAIDDRYAILLWLPDIVHALSCSNSAFASLRSGVSKPSVNLVEEMRWKGDAWLRAIP